MPFSIRIAVCALGCALGLITLSHNARAGFEKPANDSPEIHLAAGKNAAGGRDNTPDFYGLVTALPAIFSTRRSDSRLLFTRLSITTTS